MQYLHLSLRNDMLHVSQYIDCNLVQGGVAVQREQVLSDKSVLLYKTSHTLHIYCLAIAAILLAVTLQ